MVKTLKTPRLTLRPLTLDDAEKMFQNWTHSVNATKYLTWPPHGNLEVTKDRLRQQITEANEEWGIVDTQTQELMGVIDVVGETTETQTKIIGYVLGEKFWNKGYMTEALEAVIAYLFDATAVNRIEATHDIANPGSGKVMEKAGMTFEGILRQAARNNQGVVDIAIYSILRADLEELTASTDTSSVPPLKQ